MMRQFWQIVKFCFRLPCNCYDALCVIPLAVARLLKLRHIDLGQYLVTTREDWALVGVNLNLWPIVYIADIVLTKMQNESIQFHHMCVCNVSCNTYCILTSSFSVSNSRHRTCLRHRNSVYIGRNLGIKRNISNYWFIYNIIIISTCKCNNNNNNNNNDYYYYTEASNASEQHYVIDPPTATNHLLSLSSLRRRLYAK